MPRQANAQAVEGNFGVTGDVEVIGTVYAAAVAATSVSGLTFEDAPVEVDSESVTLADDIYAALVTLGLIVDVA